MKIVTKEYKIFKFDELSEKAQENVLDDFRNEFVDFDKSWYSDIVDEPCENTKNYYGKISLKDIKIETFDIYRNIAMLKGEINITKFLIDFNYLDKYKNLLPLIDNMDMVYITTDNYYEINNLELPDFETLKDRKIRKELHDDIANVLMGLKKEILKSLNETYDYFTSDEYIKKMIDINEYEFFETGEILHS
jgi:hypothetical protein